MKACFIAAILVIAAGTMADESPRYLPEEEAPGGISVLQDPEHRINYLRDLLNQFDKRTAAIEKQLPVARKSAQALPLPLEPRQELRDKDIQHPSVHQAIDGIIAQYFTSLQAQELELIGLEARREAIQRAMAEQAERLKTLVKEDAIFAQLQQVVLGREANLERIKKMHEASMAPATEVSAAAGALAEARVRLLERQETVADRNGGDVLAAWNRELMNLAVDAAEKQAKQRVMDARLAALRDAWKARLDLADLENEQQRMAAERNLAENELRQLEKQRKQPAAK